MLDQALFGQRLRSSSAQIELVGRVPLTHYSITSELGRSDELVLALSA
jgi:hypothetical protein